MKNMREFAIALGLVGLVGVNFVYLANIFFEGLSDALFRQDAGVLISWKSVALVAFANLMVLVGFFYLLIWSQGGATEKPEGESTEP
ncbi:MAG: hypothetical protein V3U93_09580 [Alphaproteobacteria bacterium]